MLDTREREILTELAECSGVIDDCNYSEQDRFVLRQLQADRLIVLSWRLLPAGKLALKTK